MTTLILPPRYTEDSQFLWQAAQKLGWETIRLHRWQITDEIKAIKDPVIYVEALFAPMLAEALGISFLEPPESWLPDLPGEYRKREIVLTTLSEARKIETPFFCKPPNDKAFQAKVFDNGKQLPEWDDMKVLTQEVVKWKREFRCFVMNNEVVTASIYLRDGIIQREQNYICPKEELEGAIKFANKVLDSVTVPKAVVMDVGEIEGKGWAVVELNAAWGSGIYGCDPIKVLETLKLCCEKS